MQLQHFQLLFLSRQNKVFLKPTNKYNNVFERQKTNFFAFMDTDFIKGFCQLSQAEFLDGSMKRRQLSNVIRPKPTWNIEK